MKTTTQLLLLTTVIALLFSCNRGSNSVQLLSEAQNIVESDPDKALVLLDSITNPQDMDEDAYMQYIVTHVQAKYKTYKDITGDTLILNAQKYFENNNNHNFGTRADLYSGSVFFEQKKYDSAIKYFYKSLDNAQKVNDTLFIARSRHNIGDMYFIADKIDSAAINYKQALHNYAFVKNTDINKLQVTDLLGRSFHILNELDSAQQYYDKGLALAEQINNKAYQGTFIHRKGVLNRSLKQYAEASKLLHESLKYIEKPSEIALVNLNLARLYTNTKQADSATYYTDRVKSRLPEITDNYVLERVCELLSDYYQWQGNHKEALQYKNLQNETQKKIQEASNSDRLLEKDRQYKASLKDKEDEAAHLRYILSLVASFFALILIVAVAYIRNRNLRQKHHREVEKNKALKIRNKLLNERVEKLVFMQDIYQNFFNDWSSIDKEVKTLSTQYGTTEEPPLIKKVRFMADDIKRKTDQNLICWAREYLLRFPSGEAAVASLNDKDLMLFMLCYCRYSLKEIAYILNVKPVKQNIYNRKLDIFNKLKHAGFPVDETNKVLFGEEVSGTSES